MHRPPRAARRLTFEAWRRRSSGAEGDAVEDPLEARVLFGPIVVEDLGHLLAPK
jgi:hypothetical protein